MSAPTIEEYFYSLPPFTKSYLIAILSTLFVTTFGIISPKHLYLDFEYVFRQFQIWRLFTCFLYLGGLSFAFIFNIGLLGRYFRELELNYYPGLRGLADFVYMIAFGSFFLWIAAYIFNMAFLAMPLTFFVIQVFCRKDPDRMVVFYGFTFRQWHLPFLLLVFSIVLGGDPMTELMGILVGHLYHFLDQIVPKVYGQRWIHTPPIIQQWIVKFFPSVGNQRAFTGAAGGSRVDNSAQPPPAPRQAWMRGPGYRLDQ
jgi:Derlin-2/3